MWTPTQLLAEDTVKALQMGGFPPLQIEFLGWLSGYAQALNNSTNPVKAAHTILSKPKSEEMWEKFSTKKIDTIKPKDRDDHYLLDKKARKLQEKLDQIESETVPLGSELDSEDL
jgi:hypothetical protein